MVSLLAEVVRADGVVPLEPLGLLPSTLVRERPCLKSPTDERATSSTERGESGQPDMLMFRLGEGRGATPPDPDLDAVPLRDRCLDNCARVGFAEVGGGIDAFPLAGLGSVDHIPPLEGKLEENKVVEGPAPKLLETLVPPLSYSRLPSRGDPVAIGSDRP